MASSGKSFGGFVDYTEREEAVELDLKKVVDPEAKYQDFGGYVGYMGRDSATTVDQKGRNLTSTFDDNQDHLSLDDIDKLKDNLKEAQANNSNIYAHVISFSTKFLKDNGIYDDKTNQLDQKALREIVRGSMNDFIQETPLKNPIWWGAVHVNTDHVHVHIGMTEVRPTTKEVTVGDHKEFRGKLPEFSFNVLKKNVVRRTLERGRNPELKKTKSLEKDLSFLRQKTVKSVDGSKFNLQQLMLALPRNKKLWRYGSNAKEMKQAKQILKGIVNDFKNQSDDYKKWLKDTNSLMKIATKNYGKNDGLINRIDDIDERLGNQILKFCKDADSSDLQLSVENLTKDFSKEAIDNNQQIIKNISEQLRELKQDKGTDNLVKINEFDKELSSRKIALKQQNAKHKISGFKDKIAKIQKISKEDLGTADKNLFNKLSDMAVKGLEEQIELNELKQQPPFKLSETEQKRLKTLENRYVDAVNIPIDKVNEQMIKELEQKAHQLPNLRNIAKTKESQALKKDYPELDIRENERNILILQLKYKIKQNKVSGKDNLKNYRKLKQLTGVDNANKNGFGDIQYRINIGKNYNKNLRVFKNAKIQAQKATNKLKQTIKEATQDVGIELQNISQRQRKEKEAMNRMLDENRRDDQERTR